jgi:hypothetical protein
MAAATHNITIEQGATFLRTLTLKNSDDTPFDLTGYTARGQIRRNHRSGNVAASFTCTITDPTAGEIQIKLTAATTADLPIYDHVYDIEIELTAASTVSRILEGTVTVSPEVTRS